MAKAESLKPWLDRKADIGYRIIGIVCDDDPWQIEHSSFQRWVARTRW